MLPFFRKIRYRLAEDNQFFKYSRYAIGEIVLVVIGILIALYINNWNEERKEQKKFDEALVEVEKELISNIRRCRRAMGVYVWIDSVANRVLHDTLTKNDYRRDSVLALSRFLRLNPGLTVRDQAFLKLSAINGDMNSETDSIKIHLTDLYVNAASGVDAYDKIILEFNNDILEAYKDKDWFLDWLGFKSLREDMIDFFLNDPEHKKNVALFATKGLKLHYRSLDEFEKKARKSYREIHHYLVNSGLSHSDSLLFTYDVEDFKHYIGTYKMDWYSFPLIRPYPDSVEIKLENKKLFYTTYLPNGTGNSIEILPINKFHYRFVKGRGFHRLIFDQNDEVIGLEYSQGGDLVKHKKIR